MMEKLRKTVKQLFTLNGFERVFSIVALASAIICAYSAVDNSAARAAWMCTAVWVVNCMYKQSSIISLEEIADILNKENQALWSRIRGLKDTIVESKEES